MIETATTIEHDIFCDCQACLNRLVANLNTLNAGRPAPKLDDFDDQADDATEAPASTICLHCGRTLRSQRSIREAQRNGGYGRGCARKITNIAKTVDLTGCKADQLAKATELIEDGAIVPIRGRRVFRAVSSDGARTYLTAPTACTCAAGLRGHSVCFHRVAASILAAA
jgi:hypothetical protein